MSIHIGEMSLEVLQQEIECDQFYLAKWSPIATKINCEFGIGKEELDSLQRTYYILCGEQKQAFPLTIKLVFFIILLSLCNDEKKKKTLDHEEHPSQALSEAREGWGCIMDFLECMDYNFYTSFLLGHLG